jgi:hypothetical protein
LFRLLLSEGVVALGGIPQQAKGLFAEARRYEQAGDLKNAEKAYIRYLQEFPGSAQAHANLGVVYGHETKFDLLVTRVNKSPSLARMACCEDTRTALTSWAARRGSTTPLTIATSMELLCRRNAESMRLTPTSKDPGAGASGYRHS